MGRTSLVYYAAASALILASPASAQKISKAEAAAMAADIDAVRSKSTVTGFGPLDVTEWVSTEGFYKTSPSDRFMRASIDRKTGHVTYQLYLSYGHGRDWFIPSTLNYEADGGPKQAVMSRVGSDVNCSRYGCFYTEDTVTSFDRADLEWVAKGAKPGGESWNLKMYGRYTDGIDFMVLKTEVAALLAMVDTELAKLKTE